MSDTIIYEVAEGVARITLNRPDKRNALSLALMQDLHDALWDADSDRSVHAVGLSGAGPCFSAGYDLDPSSDLMTFADDVDRRSGMGFDDDVWFLERAQRLRMAIFDMHKPVIAQVHGHCLAGGTDVALLCDMVIAADDALFGFPPARDFGALPNNMWLYQCGPQWAKRLTLTGDLITGEDAARIGLVMKSVPSQHLAAEVDGLLNRLARIDPDLLSANKRIVNLGLELMGARTLQRLAAENDARGHSSRAARRFMKSVQSEGVRAAIAHRDAQFPDGFVRVTEPEIRDADGSFVPTPASA